MRVRRGERGQGEGRGGAGGCLCLQVSNREVDRYFFKVFFL